ncbi:MAG: aspartate ammonia-lyase [Candidatus Aminicenantes bacterium]|nr:aspartate ammonia-lyase [Candidatus Aminicenantes bacterium]
MKKDRIEKDFLGEIHVPADAYYGVHTQRSSLNFPISGLRLQSALIEGMVYVKKATAKANAESGKLDNRIADAIDQSCEEILAGKLKDEFIVDVFQMGAGTSFHMNCNEVLANRAEEILGGEKGQYRLVHPNDHVNMGQSTNDVFPTAMRLGVLFLLKNVFFPSLENLTHSFLNKAKEFDLILKSGRTHLQDAAPIRLGQEFKAYGMTLIKCEAFLRDASRSLLELGIGGSAVGTGLNVSPDYVEKVVFYLSGWTGFDLRPAEDLRESMQSMRPMAEVSGGLRNLALELTRIANDLRLLSSGPRTGLAEIQLPAVAPGSSAMPGKINPSMLEMMNMVCYQVLGCDLTVSGAVQAGQLELNVMMPVIAFNLNFMIDILGRAMAEVSTRCIDGIQANVERCQSYAEESLALATALSPHIGYEKASEVAREAYRTGKSIAEVTEEKGLLSREKIRKILDPKNLT